MDILHDKLVVFSHVSKDARPGIRFPCIFTLLKSLIVNHVLLNNARTLPPVVFSWAIPVDVVDGRNEEVSISWDSAVLENVVIIYPLCVLREVFSVNVKKPWWVITVWPKVAGEVSTRTSDATGNCAYYIVA